MHLDRLGLRVALASAAMLMAGSLAAFAAPNVQFSKTTFDFGEARQGAKVNLTFPFKNTGDQTLTIGNIQTSCGCTNATASANSIAPGASGQIKAVFNAGTFSGKITKTITVSTNDPNAGTVQLNVAGYVKPAAEVFPKSINFGVLKSGKIFKQTLVVKPLEPAKFTIDGVTSPAKYLTFATPRKSATVKGAWEIPVTIDTSKAQSGRRFEMIQIRTSEKAAPMLVVRVLGEVKSS